VPILTDGTVLLAYGGAVMTLKTLKMKASPVVWELTLMAFWLLVALLIIVKK
jgi:hypothetical protein